MSASPGNRRHLGIAAFLAWVGLAVGWPACSAATGGHAQPTAAPVAPPPPLPPGVASDYLLGVTLLGQGDAAGAFPFLDRAYRYATDQPHIAEALLAALLGTGQLERAQTVLDQMSRSAPDNLELRKQRIALLTDRRLYSEALDEIGRARGLAAGGPEDDELLLMEGEVLARSGRWQEALPLYLAANERLPERREQILPLVAALLARSGRAQESPALWRAALAGAPGSGALRQGLLRELVAQGEDRAAIAVADEGDVLARGAAAARDGEPDIAQESEGAAPASWLAYLGNLLAQAGRPAVAQGLFQERWRAGKLALEPALWLAQALVREDKLAEAEQLLREMTRRWPQAGRAQQFLGETLMSRGDHAGGEEALRRAVAADPREPEFQVSLVRALAVGSDRATEAGEPADKLAVRRQELRRAAEGAAAAVRIDDRRGRMILGFAFRGLGDHAQASLQFAAAAAEPQFRREALLQLAACQDDLRLFNDARSTLETLIKEYPDDATIANFLGYFLAERGVELERAERLIQQALATDPDSPEYIDSLGWVAYRRGDFQRAFDLLVTAVNSRPNDPIILEHLGLTLRALGQHQEAARIFRRALAAGGDAEQLSAWLRELDRNGEAP